MRDPQVPVMSRVPALKCDVVPAPVHRNDPAVPEADQEIDVRHAPEDPGNEARELDLAELVRLLVPIHHRIRLLTFPMRTRRRKQRRPDTRSPRFRCDRHRTLAADRRHRRSLTRVQFHSLDNVAVNWAVV
jgi:hypothetical protein